MEKTTMIFPRFIVFTQVASGERATPRKFVCEAFLTNALHAINPFTMFDETSHTDPSMRIRSKINTIFKKHVPKKDMMLREGEDIATANRLISDLQKLSQLEQKRYIS